MRLGAVSTAARLPPDRLRGCDGGIVVSNPLEEGSESRIGHKALGVRNPAALHLVAGKFVPGFATVHRAGEPFEGFVETFHRNVGSHVGDVDRHLFHRIKGKRAQQLERRIATATQREVRGTRIPVTALLQLGE